MPRKLVLIVVALLLVLVGNNATAAPAAQPQPAVTVTAPDHEPQELLEEMASPMLPGGSFNGLAFDGLAATVAAGDRRPFPNRTALESWALGGEYEAVSKETKTNTGWSIAFNGDNWPDPGYWWGWFDSPRWSGRTAGRTATNSVLGLGFIRQELGMEDFVGAWSNGLNGVACLFLVDQNLGSCVQPKSETGIVTATLEIPGGVGHILTYVWVQSAGGSAYAIGEFYNNPTIVAAARKNLDTWKMPVPSKLQFPELPDDLRQILLKK